MQDLAIYTLFLDIRIEVISVDEIHADSTDAQLLLACRPATFPEECFKRRVVCAVLSKNHSTLEFCSGLRFKLCLTSDPIGTVLKLLS